jgi:hypothetical protein
MALAFPANSFDAAVIALVFIPEPAKGVAAAWVVVPARLVAAYPWDVVGGGFPLDPILEEMRAMELAPLRLPQADASRMDALRH